MKLFEIKTEISKAIKVNNEGETFSAIKVESIVIKHAKSLTIKKILLTKEYILKAR